MRRARLLSYGCLSTHGLVQVFLFGCDPVAFMFLLVSSRACGELVEYVLVRGFGTVVNLEVIGTVVGGHPDAHYLLRSSVFSPHAEVGDALALLRLLQDRKLAVW